METNWSAAIEVMSAIKAPKAPSESFAPKLSGGFVRDLRWVIDGCPESSEQTADLQMAMANKLRLQTEVGI